MKRIFLGIITVGFLLNFEVKSVVEETSTPPDTSSTVIETNQNNSYIDALKRFQKEIKEIYEENTVLLKNINDSKEKLLKNKTTLESKLKEYQQLSEEIEKLKINEEINQLKSSIEDISNVTAELQTNEDKEDKSIDESQDNPKKETKANKKNKKKDNVSKEEEVDWNSIQLTEKLLKGYYNALSYYDISYNRVKEWGYKFFENNDYRKFFLVNKNTPPSLKNLFLLIYDTRYPAARETWRKIKTYEQNKEYPKNLELLRSQIQALLKNVSSLLRQYKKLEQKKKRKNNAHSRVKKNNK